MEGYTRSRRKVKKVSLIGVRKPEFGKVSDSGQESVRFRPGYQTPAKNVRFRQKFPDSGRSFLIPAGFLLVSGMFPGFRHVSWFPGFLHVSWFPADLGLV